MKSEQYIITKKEFPPPNCNGVKVKDYGEEFDPWWGYDMITLSVSEVIALIKGKVLETSVNQEYGLLIRMTPEEMCDE